MNRAPTEGRVFSDTVILAAVLCGNAVGACTAPCHPIHLPSTLKKMPATEITVTSAGKVAGMEMLIPTGQEGAYFSHLQDWLTPKLQSKKAIRDVSAQVLVKGIKQWAAYEEKAGSKRVLTVFKIT